VADTINQSKLLYQNIVIQKNLWVDILSLNGSAWLPWKNKELFCCFELLYKLTLFAHTFHKKMKNVFLENANKHDLSVPLQT